MGDGFNGAFFVGYKPDVAGRLAGISKTERVLAVTPVGYAKQSEVLQEKLMTGFGRTHTRRSFSRLTRGLPVKKWPRWIKESIEAARFAPSAVNRQPWGFYIEKDAITIFIRTRGPQFNVSKRLDCGIAMLHIEIGALNSGVRGKWEFLSSPQVAKFTVTP